MIQKRNIAMYIILSIVTCGIFGIYWFICLTDDSKLAANDNESASGPVAFLLTIVTCGIYSWYWAYKLGDRVDYAANSRGIGDGSSNSKILFIFFAFCGTVFIIYKNHRKMDRGNFAHPAEITPTICYGKFPIFLRR